MRFYKTKPSVRVAFLTGLATLCDHAFAKNVVDACQVSFALRFQPIQNIRVNSYGSELLAGSVCLTEGLILFRPHGLGPLFRWQGSALRVLIQVAVALFVETANLTGDLDPFSFNGIAE